MWCEHSECEAYPPSELSGAVVKPRIPSVPRPQPHLAAKEQRRRSRHSQAERARGCLRRSAASTVVIEIVDPSAANADVGAEAVRRPLSLNLTLGDSSACVDRGELFVERRVRQTEIA